LIGMEACVGAHHLSRRLHSLGHDARLMPAKYVKPYRRGQKNDNTERYELTDLEWTTIRPMLREQATGVPRVDDQRVLNDCATGQPISWSSQSSGR
jgi:hypothetical protein